MGAMHTTAWTVFCATETDIVVDIGEGDITITQDADVIRLSLDDIEPLRAALAAAEASFKEQIAE